MPAIESTVRERPLGLQGRLGALSPEQARLTRLACDRRFTQWIDTLLQAEGSRIVQADKPSGIAVSLGCRLGRFTLRVQAAALPALEMAARLEADLARDVAEAVLADALAALEPRLPGLVVHGVAMEPAGGMQYEVRIGSWRVGLQALDEDFARQVAGLLAQVAKPGVSHLRGLRLPARLRLFVRELSLADLGSLRPGDVVLSGPAAPEQARLRCRLSFGMGTLMQANAEVELDGSEATLVDAPYVADDEADAGAPAPGTLGDLGLPVAFEIDSARVSLDELAAFGPGSVIELDASVREAIVRLVCCGQVVGTGRLVAVGDCLGVRIERMGVQGVGGRA